MPAGRLLMRSPTRRCYSPLLVVIFKKKGELAFGQKGRPASAGKPRIPADQVITFELEIVGLPGREQELIELIGDE